MILQLRLYLAAALSGLFLASVWGAQLPTRTIQTRNALDGKNCWRYSCQVQACFPAGDPDVKTAERMAYCLFGWQENIDCGNVVSGIGYMQTKAYVKCSAGSQLRQFEYTIWRSNYEDMDQGEYQLPVLDNAQSLQAYGLNCTNEEKVHCDDNAHGVSCDDAAQCVSQYGQGCRVNSTSYEGCQYKHT